MNNNNFFTSSESFQIFRSISMYKLILFESYSKPKKYLSYQLIKEDEKFHYAYEE